MSFLTQSPASGPGRFLQWKVRLFAVAAVLLLIGMAREIDVLVGVAIALLAAAFVLRFFEKDPPAEGDDELEEDGEEHAGDEYPGDEYAVEGRTPLPDRGLERRASDDLREDPRRPLE